ncbi:MAG: sigma 54-interacting transcriptional regulator [Streptococcaceae bacterium]|jgi:transcriptional regulatory protein LevR/transcriptional regulator with AAA-type ATPase domain|nr:sigma 54-interacting transcriptional regulator [Streptococcaceae bacterium]MCH4177358.1 sigma 54-interacting transcriptional regulator [Streptococcaceae bacterium]
MKRIDKIYNALFQALNHLSKEDLMQTEGLCAKEVEEMTGITRSNVSMELNKLVRLGRVVKIKSFPVKYMPQELCEDVLGFSTNDVQEVESLSEFSNKTTNNLYVYPHEDAFAQMIGSNGSLKKAVSQAKAAVYYPPNGLHILLHGPTGVGKTLFGKMIHQFMVQEKLRATEAPFVQFNCADYYNNPQLLMAQLFGYANGAFTGAEGEREGLVDIADGGILLLDEVHRLPPEGQEMLFYFIDHGRYNRLGESGKTRHSNVLIICATTETPSSTLLSTFMRRIPMIIQIPSLLDRPVEERLKLVTFLFEQEAIRINKELMIHSEMFQALLAASNYGNIGQMKSNVQLICAQAYISNFSNDQAVELTEEYLPEVVKNEWINSGGSRGNHRILEEKILPVTRISPFQHETTFSEEPAFNIYQIIEQKTKMLRESGVDDAQIEEYLKTDLNLYIQRFSENKPLDLMKFVDEEIVSFTESIKKTIEKTHQIKLDNRFVSFLSMHLDAYKNRRDVKELLSATEQERIRTQMKRDFEIAQQIRLALNDTGILNLAEDEDYFIALLLQSIETLETKKKVSVLVCAHGNSTATSMVEVAVELFGYAPIFPLDMPLSTPPEDIFIQAVDIIKEIDDGSGVLVLIDMGTLSLQQEKLIEETGVPIEVLTNVTTSMVLDVARKVNYLDISLRSLRESIQADIKRYFDVYQDNIGKQKAIIAICMTGSGTAERLKTILNNLVYHYSKEPVKIITLSALKIDDELPELIEKYDCLFACGTKRPDFDIPYISLDELICQEGEKQVKILLSNDQSFNSLEFSSRNIVTDDLITDMLNEHLVFFNPQLMSKLLENWIVSLEKNLKLKFPNATKIKLVIHTAFAVERVIRDNALIYDGEITPLIEKLHLLVEESLNNQLQRLNLTISTDEAYFIANIISDDLTISISDLETPVSK